MAHLHLPVVADTHSGCFWTQNLSLLELETSPDGNMVCRAASFTCEVLLMRWAKMREVNRMEAIVAVSMGELLGVPVNVLQVHFR